MNRIREYNYKYQVLITPTMPYHTNFELLVGNWTDEHLRNYYILEFDNMGDAHCEAMKHPDIDWQKLVLLHQNSYYDLKKLIKTILDDHRFIGEFEPKIFTPEELKNKMFDRVMYNGRRFTLKYNMNDVISFHIINPFTKNLIEIAKYLESNGRLRIFRKFVNNGVIHLIGRTDVGTTFEIGLWPTMISQWARWADENPQISNENKKYTFIESLKKQEKLDGGFELR
jgi:hypothetical protein